MSDRLYFPCLLKAQVAVTNWDRLAELFHLPAPLHPAGAPISPVQLRWMINPTFGLPLESFTVWQAKMPGPGVDPQKLINMPIWTPIERVGLPVDTAWAASHYSLDRQGPTAAGSDKGTVEPITAALERLKRGAPRVGWPALAGSPVPLPAWEAPDVEAYLKELLRGNVLHGVSDMLAANPDHLSHADFTVHDQTLVPLPRALELAGQTPTTPPPGKTTTADWKPMGTMTAAAVSDPLASLALGFGTALDVQVVPNETIFMVSVIYRAQDPSRPVDFEIADVVDPSHPSDGPEPLQGAGTRFVSATRPERTDAPRSESVELQWARPLNPVYSQQPLETGQPSGYAIGRIGPRDAIGEILLTRRPSPVKGGWLPFVASRPTPADAPVRFRDHLTRGTTVAGQSIGDPIPRKWTYAVAGQDLFGRFTPWVSTDYASDGEQAQTPTVFSVKFDAAGHVEIIFSWDWSDRSPQFIELTGNFHAAPAARLFTIHLTFAGQSSPSGFTVEPLTPDLKPAGSFGAAQDRAGRDPEVRCYRVSVSLPLPLNFGGQRSLVLQVSARGQLHLHEVLLPGFRFSSFGALKEFEVFDFTPPAPPVVRPLEAPLWASLPDVSGISRAIISWAPSANAKGYILYEATESTLLAAMGLGEPDTTRSFPLRLVPLRDGPIQDHRRCFRRVQRELIPPEGAQGFELTFPRGTGVMHFFAITAVSQNEIESDWPDGSKKFVAYAVPRLANPSAPALRLAPSADKRSVDVTVLLRDGKPAEVELYHVRAPQVPGSVDEMGPPRTTLPPGTPPPPGGSVTVEFNDTLSTPDWTRRWYRAVVWAPDDLQNGVFAARSPASPPVGILLPPTDPPDLHDLRVNEHRSSEAESLVSWASSTPTAPTPLGSHTATVEYFDAANASVGHFSAPLEEVVTFATEAALPDVNPVNRQILAVGAAGTSARRYHAWVPRPPDNSAFNITVKMIDPLGLVASLLGTVPPLPPQPLPKLGSLSRLSRLVAPGAPRVVVAWEILSPIDSADLANYTLSVTPPGVHVTLDRVKQMAGLVGIPGGVALALTNVIVRQLGAPRFFIFLMPGVPIVTVSLQDPQGRNVTVSI